MVIEESIDIEAPLDKVWKTFTDLTCWQDWNTIMKYISSDGKSIEKGANLKFCIRPFMVPIYIEPFIVEVVIGKLIVWSSSKFGIFAKHEFIFEESEKKTIVKSKESFKGITVDRFPSLFPEKVIRSLTRSFLKDLKKFAEGE